MIDGLDVEEDGLGAASPVWPVFGDLMSCLFGLFVLFFVWIVAFQVTLAQDLAEEKSARQAEQARLETLEQALAVPLRAGTITLVGGRINIQGSVLFDSSSAELAPEGGRLLRDLAPPLTRYLEQHDELIMVSGFTDDRPITGSRQGYRDNWELSSERALTVTRALIGEGLPRERVVAAGFGATHFIATNDTAEGRAQNRRVEIAPIPQQKKAP